MKRIAKVRSSSDGRKFYVVSKVGHKHACSCQAWIFRRLRCKHIKAACKAKKSSHNVKLLAA